MPLKDTCFDRLPDYCIDLDYLTDDMAECLKAFADILNNIAIIGRSFV